MKYKTRNFLEGEYRSQYPEYVNSSYKELSYQKTLFPYFIILFLVSPVLALISAMFNFRKQGAKSTIYLFMAAFGYTFILNPGMDAYKTSMEFVEHYQYLSPTGFANEIWTMLTLGVTGSLHAEPYMAIVSYTIAQFSSDTNIFMMVVSFIYGLAYIKGIQLVYEEREDHWNFVTLFLFIFFITWIGIVGINHPRQFTGGCVYFVGAYLYIRSQNYKYLLIVLLTPFIHFMFLVVAIPLGVYVMFKDLKYVYLAILIISFASPAGLPVLEEAFTATELGENKVEDYTVEELWDPSVAPSAFETKESFHSEYYRAAGNLAVNFMFLLTIIFSGYFTGKYHDKLQNGLASLAILTLSLSNFTEAIPAVSGRTHNYFGLFALAYLLRLFSKRDKTIINMNWIIYLCSPAALLYIFTMYSKAGDFIDFKILISPLLYPFLGDDPFSLKELLRTLLF